MKTPAGLFIRSAGFLYHGRRSAEGGMNTDKADDGVKDVTATTTTTAFFTRESTEDTEI